MNSDILVKKIQELVKEYFESKDKEKKFIPGETRIPLQTPSYDWEEVNESLDSLLSTYVTMGKKVELFERLFSNYLNLKYATMVNSGSSANLISLSILTNPTLSNGMKPGDEVITPAATWATTVFPIGDVNTIPVLVDIDLETLNISIDEIEKAITNKTKAIMPVHLLGNPCCIKEIMQIANDNDLFVIEDCCEAHGAEVDGKKVGTFGDMSTFSFFFSHIISTIEGGIIATNNEEFYELSKALRVFGWARNLKKYEEYAKKYNDIDKRFLFVNKGFNMRPTEIQGAFGMHQIKKLEKFIKIRRENADFWNKRLSEHSDYLSTQEERPGTRHAWFGFSLTIKPNSPFTRDEMVKFLEERKIETRPVMIPNIAKQPAINFIKHRVVGDLKNSTYIMNNSFWFGNHHGIGKEEREYIAACIDEFIRSKVKK
jgi:CDP-6-deoxy-D-xylo-4-hexulose-3-dehydrase